MGTPDFTKFRGQDPLKPKGPKERNRLHAQTDVPNEAWWKMEGAEAAMAISATIDFLQKHQDNRMQSLAIATKLYGSQGLGMFPWGSPVSPFPSVNAPSPYMTNRIKLNIVQRFIATG